MGRAYHVQVGKGTGHRQLEEELVWMPLCNSMSNYSLMVLYLTINAKDAYGVGSFFFLRLI